MPVCLTDPAHDLLYCDGQPKPWKDASGYVCQRLDDFRQIMKSCGP